MIRLRTAITALMLLAAAPAFAQAQGDSARYRMLTLTDRGAMLVGTEVTGPQTQRRISEIVIPTAPAPSGATSFIAVYTVNCTAGTLAMGEVRSFIGTTQQNIYPDGDGKGMYTPTEGSPAALMIAYACTGTIDNDDATILTGFAAALTYGRGKLGLDE